VGSSSANLQNDNDNEDNKNKEERVAVQPGVTDQDQSLVQQQYAGDATMLARAQQ